MTTIKTVADLRRELTPGRRFRVTNYLYPNVSGERVISQSGPTRFTYDYTKADGTEGRNGRGEWPKRDEVRFEGSDVHFLYDPKNDPERIAFTYHLGEQ